MEEDADGGTAVVALGAGRMEAVFNTTAIDLVVPDIEHTLAPPDSGDGVLVEDLRALHPCTTVLQGEHLQCIVIAQRPHDLGEGEVADVADAMWRRVCEAMQFEVQLLSTRGGRNSIGSRGSGDASDVELPPSAFSSSFELSGTLPSLLAKPQQHLEPVTQQVQGQHVVHTADGHAVFYLTTPIIVDSDYLGNDLLLLVTVSFGRCKLQGHVINRKPRSELSYHALLDRLYSDSRSYRTDVPLRHLHWNVCVAHPLHVETSSTRSGTRNHIRVSVANVHTGGAVLLRDVDVRLDSGHSSGVLSQKCVLWVETGELPVRIGVGEEFCFVVTVEPSGSVDDMRSVVGRFESTLLLSWVPAYGKHAQASILSSYPLRWSRPALENMMLTLECPSPVELYQVFPVSVTLSNLTGKRADLTMEVHHDPNATVALAATDDGAGAGRTGEGKGGEKGVMSLVCLERAWKLGVLEPRGTVSVVLHFVGMEEGLARIPRVQLVDAVSGTRFEMAMDVQLLVLRNPPVE